MATYLIDIPDTHGMSKPDTAEYIVEAVTSWASGAMPDHPFYGHVLDTDQPNGMRIRTLTAEQALTVHATLRRIG